MRRHAWVLLLLIAGPPPGRLAAQPTIPPERAEARDAFRRSKVGRFVHRGVYSALMDGEWVMNHRGITAAEYQRIPPRFNPTAFNPADWVNLARIAGLRYITLTTRHHDDFVMWATAVNDWNIVARTPYGRDVVRQLADACRTDGMWNRPDADWRLERTYRMTHELQPATLIMPNHHRAPLPGEDIQTFEKDLPGASTAGFNTTSVGAPPLETSEATNDSWGFRRHDHHFKSPSTLLREPVNAAGPDANFLLNVGPMPSGKIRPEFLANLRENRAYLHLLEWTDRTLALPADAANPVVLALGT